MDAIQYADEGKRCRCVGTVPASKTARMHQETPTFDIRVDLWLIVALTDTLGLWCRWPNEGGGACFCTRICRHNCTLRNFLRYVDWPSQTPHSHSWFRFARSICFSRLLCTEKCSILRLSTIMDAIVLSSHVGQFSAVRSPPCVDLQMPRLEKTDIAGCTITDAT